MVPSTKGLGVRAEALFAHQHVETERREIVGQRFGRADTCRYRRPSSSHGSSRSTRPACRKCPRGFGTRSCRCCRSGHSGPAHNATRWRTASSGGGRHRTSCRPGRSGRRPRATRRPGTARSPAPRCRDRPCSSSAAMRVQATCREAATNTACAASPAGTLPSRKRSARASSSATPPVVASAARARRAASGSRPSSVFSRMCAQRHPPALVAPPGRRIERCAVHQLCLGDLRRPRAARPASGRRAPRAGLRRELRSRAKKPSSSWPSASTRSRSARRAQDRGEIGQADKLALGDRAKGVFAVTGARVGRAGTQGLPTSWRNHLRWCFQAQPPVTEPRVMALQRALHPDGGIDCTIQIRMAPIAHSAWTTADNRFCSIVVYSTKSTSHRTKPLPSSARIRIDWPQKTSFWPALYLPSSAWPLPGR